MNRKLAALLDPVTWGLAGAIFLVTFSYGAAMWLAEISRSIP
jgi:hypothetical protein